MRLLNFVKDVQEELQGTEQVTEIPPIQEFRNQPVGEQQELK